MHDLAKVLYDVPTTACGSRIPPTPSPEIYAGFSRPKHPMALTKINACRPVGTMKSKTIPGTSRRCYTPQLKRGCCPTAIYFNHSTAYTHPSALTVIFVQSLCQSIPVRRCRLSPLLLPCVSSAFPYVRIGMRKKGPKIGPAWALSSWLFRSPPRRG